MSDSPRAFLVADSLRVAHETATVDWGWARLSPLSAWLFRTVENEMVRALALADAEDILRASAGAKVFLALPYIAPGRNATHDWLQRAVSSGLLARVEPFTAAMVEVNPGARYRSPDLTGHAGKTQGEIIASWGSQEGWSRVSAARAFHSLLANGGMVRVPEGQG